MATSAARATASDAPKREMSRHALFYADLTSLAPMFVLACTTYMGLKLLREKCLMDKHEFEAREELARLERELRDLRQAQAHPS